MITSVDDYQQLHEVIAADLQTSECKNVLVFVSGADIDAVAAARTLKDVFENTGAHFSVFPVVNYAQVKVHCESLVDGEEYQNIFFLNCGAREDLPELLGLTDNVRAIVIDSHRPLHHNMAAWENIIFIADSADTTVQQEEFTVPDGASDAEEGMDTDEEAGTSDDDDLDKENQRPAQRRRVSESAEPVAAAAARAQKRAAARERKREVRRRRREHYEHGCTWGRPAAAILYGMAREMHMETNYMLWHAILGMTDQLVHQRCSPSQYERLAEEVETLVRQGAEVAHELDEWEEVHVEDADGVGAAYTRRRTVYGKISPCEDFRFPLMRQWSVREALVHSRYVAVRLQTWQDRGRRQVDELLARMGLPLKHCKQDFCVKPTLFKDLSVKLEAHAHAFKLNDVTFKSFQLQYGASAALHAADVVLSATALLEAPSPAAPADQADLIADEAVRENYISAFNSLAVRDGGELRSGLEQAKRLQRAVLSDGGLVLTKSAIRAGCGRGALAYDFVDLGSEEIAHKALLAQPAALVRAALFLRDAHNWRRGSSARALVAAGPPCARGWCHIVSVADPPQAGAQQGNQFGLLFHKAAANIGGGYSMDSFDATGIRVQRDDVARFLRELRAVVNAAVRRQLLHKVCAESRSWPRLLEEDDPGANSSLRDLCANAACLSGTWRDTLLQQRPEYNVREALRFLVEEQLAAKEQTAIEGRPTADLMTLVTDMSRVACYGAARSFEFWLDPVDVVSQLLLLTREAQLWPLAQSMCNVRELVWRGLAASPRFAWKLLTAEWPWTNLRRLDISYQPQPHLPWDTDHHGNTWDKRLALALCKLPRLTHLAARYSHFGLRSWRALEGSNATGLTSLDLTGCARFGQWLSQPVHVDVCMAYAQPLSAFVNLQVLVVRETAAHAFLAFALRSGRMPCLACLEKLDISEPLAGARDSDDCGQFWTPSLLVILLQRTPVLRSLAVAGCHSLAPGAAGVEWLLPCSGAAVVGSAWAAPCLHALEAGWGFDGAALAHVCMHSPFLATLIIGLGASIGDGELQVVAATCPHLRRLELRFAPISDTGVGDVLRSCAGLVSLRLMRCCGPLSNALGAALVARPRLERLAELCLAGGAERLSDAGLMLLASPRHARLRRLELRGCVSLTPDGVAAALAPHAEAAAGIFCRYPVRLTGLDPPTPMGMADADWEYMLTRVLPFYVMPRPMTNPAPGDACAGQVEPGTPMAALEALILRCKTLRGLRLHHVGAVQMATLQRLALCAACPLLDALAVDAPHGLAALQTLRLPSPRVRQLLRILNVHMA
ncbi:hypothetical protein WJX81_001467 [Elliptochloris bilobata]|uniref:Uncharacterized protein n=1 Tax=Elliptochloris bilobata TaxID=381761 RepID=A0AAW1SC43_9CHLO